ncbi:hypothetical protein [Peribacillus frigoritolerans]|uniref:hypothetical protein n=1 Tax=Peribacillus frigoritolerans TaxID=450367 RepID=UPI000FDA379B|nr:hypothetical protein [Peribacillus frigoritolerans]AZV62616.1 hypothetical protein DOZ91_20155 [Peribacillus frigoritolerans]
MLNQDVEKILSRLEALETNEVEIDLEDEEEKTISVSFHLLSRDEFEEGQLGYREDEEGNSFVGNNEGDWKESWFVIGYDEDLGDPIFVDINNKNYPILTAEHGMGEWEPSVLYDSLEDFIKDIK